MKSKSKTLKTTLQKFFNFKQILIVKNLFGPLRSVQPAGREDLGQARPAGGQVRSHLQYWKTKRDHSWNNYSIFRSAVLYAGMESEDASVAIPRTLRRLARTNGESRWAWRSATICWNSREPMRPSWSRSMCRNAWRACSSWNSCTRTRESGLLLVILRAVRKEADRHESERLRTYGNAREATE